MSDGPAVVGVLYVVSTPIGNLGDVTERARQVLSSCGLICCEDTRHTGQMLARLGIEPSRLLSLHAHNERSRVNAVLEALRAGKDVALVSDAGTPLVSDPGQALVRSVLDEGLRAVPVPGPSAVLAAIVVSGFGLSRWRFEGFLPRKGPERSKRVQVLARASEPCVVYESPLRVHDTLVELLEACGPDRRVCVARELTKLHEQVWHGSLKEAVERQDATPRGEHVIVLDGATTQHARPSSDELRSMLVRLVESGLRKSDAVRALEVLYEVPHRVAYALSLELGASGA